MPGTSGAARARETRPERIIATRSEAELKDKLDENSPLQYRHRSSAADLCAALSLRLAVLPSSLLGAPAKQHSNIKQRRNLSERRSGEMRAAGGFGKYSHSVFSCIPERAKRWQWAAARTRRRALRDLPRAPAAALAARPHTVGLAPVGRIFRCEHVHSKREKRATERTVKKKDNDEHRVAMDSTCLPCRALRASSQHTAKMRHSVEVRSG